MRKSFMMIAVLALAGCKQAPQLPSIISPYRIDIQQGNVVTQDMVAKLKAGMTRSQVRFVLGSPLVTDMFHGDRWDYVYLMQKQGRADERRRLTVIFDGDKLATIEGDVVLSDKELEPAAHPQVPAGKPAPVKPAVAPALKPEVAKPALKPPVAPQPEVATPSITPKPAAKPEVATPSIAPKPAAKPEVAAPAVAPTPAPVAKPEQAPDAVKPAADADAANTQAAQPAAPGADAAKPEETQPAAPKPEAAKPDSVKSDAAATEEKKEPPKRSGIGRMLDKIGF